MPIPPEPIITAARRWLELYPEMGEAQTRALLTNSPTFADLTATQYATAFNWLEDHGLLDDTTHAHAREAHIYESAIQDADWFADADRYVRGPDELPEDALTVSEALGLDDVTAYAHLVACWGRVDTEIRERIGSAGEHALAELLRRSVDGTVRHVALEQDGLGYDIEVTGSEATAHIEVKTTTRQGRARIYLSRHEFEVMKRDRFWCLAAVRLDDGMQIETVHWIDPAQILEAAPRDASASGRWESCRFDVPLNATVPGLPPLRPIFHQIASPLLTGASCRSSRFVSEPGDYAVEAPGAVCTSRGTDEPLATDHTPSDS